MSATLSTMKDAATVIALLVAGGWAIYRFTLHRTLNSFVKLELVGDVFVTQGGPTWVLLGATATNPSTTGVARRLAWIELQPLTTAGEPVQRITSVQPKKTDDARLYGIFGSFKYLEPGEDFQDSLLVAVPSGTRFVLVKLFFSGGRPGETWRIHKIFALSLSHPA
ncbi:hypothetical protein [Actinoplanes sp. HUAS TT8]|uniref:hypothetical protein n=1 Tax=Actinoplanes sp. HUAS TT8 TaxID=3447453 RepID=UPI003F52293F